jgi:phosphopantetheinyl transferase
MHLDDAVELMRRGRVDIAVLIVPEVLCGHLLDTVGAPDDDDLRHVASRPLEQQRRSLAAAWALRAGIAAWGEDPTEGRLVWDQRGRPYSTNGRPQVSAAHDPLTVAVAFAISQPVGIDVESRSRRLSPGVVDFLTPVGEPDPLAGWTAYEAIAKANGRGLALPVDHLARVRGTPRWRVDDVEEYAVTHRKLATGSLMAVAWQNETPPRLAIAALCTVPPSRGLASTSVCTRRGASQQGHVAPRG